MKKHVLKNSAPLQLLKALLAAYITTGILLLLLAFLLYKFALPEGFITGSVIVVYVLSTFLGGLFAGKLMKVRRFFWGLLTGNLYFALRFLITLGVQHTLESSAANILTTLLLCAGGGMLGGMLS